MITGPGLLFDYGRIDEAPGWLLAIVNQQDGQILQGGIKKDSPSLI
jgi:hypothetical protein